MKRMLFIFIMSFVAIVSYAQSDITTFLGIPVEGTKKSMIEKLEEKGYVYDSISELLRGEFNGEPVTINIHTVNNRVWRLIVADINSRDEEQIKERYNRLVRQFENNKRYIHFSEQQIPNDEDVSYEMNIHDKQYQAIYYQQFKPELLDTLTIQTVVRERVLEKYTEEQLENPTPEIQQDVFKISTDYVIEVMSKKTVWFSINEAYGQYRIAIYYENGYNEANGEDL